MVVSITRAGHLPLVAEVSERILLARLGHIHLSTFDPEQPTRRAIILTTPRLGLHTVVLCVGVRVGPTHRRALGGV